MYAAWTKAEELSYRIVELHAEDVEANDTNDKRRKRLHKRRSDLNTMLNIIGGKTDQYNFDDVLKIIQFSEAIYKFFCVVEEVDSCGFCGEDFITVGEYLDHMEIHGFICPRCVKFYSNWSLFHAVYPI